MAFAEVGLARALPANSLEIILTYFANFNSKNPKAHIEFLVKYTKILTKILSHLDKILRVSKRILVFSEVILYPRILFVS